MMMGGKPYTVSITSLPEFLPSRNAETTARATDSDAALRMSQV